MKETETKASQYRRAEQEEIIKERKYFERIYFRKWETLLNDQLEPVLKVIELTQRTDLVSIDNAIKTTDYINLFTQMYIEVGSDFASREFASFKHLHVPMRRKKQTVEPSWIDYFRDYVFKFGAEKIRSITDTTRKNVKELIAIAGERGYSIPKTVSFMRQAWKQGEGVVSSRARATLIARTEILTASNTAQFSATNSIAEQLDLKLNKTWLGAADLRERPSHLACNGQTVDINGKFIVGGFFADHPGDIALPIRESAMCRCSFFVSPKE